MSYYTMTGGQPNASWNEEPVDPNDPFATRRAKLAAAIRGGLTRGGGARPLFGGRGPGSRSAFNMPMAALPALSFDPFAAQQGLGVPGLMGPAAAGVGGTPGGLPGVGNGAPVGNPGGGFYGTTQAGGAPSVGAPRHDIGVAPAPGAPAQTQAQAPVFRPYGPQPNDPYAPVLRLLRGF